MIIFSDFPYVMAIIEQITKYQLINSILKKLIMSTQSLEISSIREFALLKLQPYLKKFQKMQNISNQYELCYFQWISFCSYTVSELIKAEYGKFAQLNLDYTGHQDRMKSQLLEHQGISFLSSWISKTELYKGKHINKNVKDRKNSFFRLINRYLKRLAKREFDSEKSQYLNIFQSKLNKNMVSGKDIKRLSQLWSSQIKKYLESSQIIIDILKINKSKVSQHYYLLHLKEISIYAQKQELNTFPFYEKINGIQNSIKRIIDIVFSQQSNSIDFQQKKICQQQEQKEQENWSFQMDSDSRISNILQIPKQSSKTQAEDINIQIQLMNESYFLNI